MSGECEKCCEHSLECKCRSLCHHQQNDSQHSYKPLNVQLKPLGNEKQNSFCEVPSITWITVYGREAHEAIIKDAAMCQELGLDQIYETIVYLKRWGGWLRQ